MSASRMGSVTPLRCVGATRGIVRHMEARTLLAAAAALFLSPVLANAKIRSETVEYKHGDTVLEGYAAWDSNPAVKTRPAVIVVHEWKGLGDYAKKRADQLAAMGYYAFAADIYGKGVRPKDHEEAGKTAGLYRKDRTLMRARIQAAVDLVKARKVVDPSKVAAIGYCFGGTTVLELARSGADVVGVASFHGALDTPTPAEPGKVKASVIVFHGADDKHVNPAVPGFMDEMRKAGADWQFVAYGGAVHSFTVPDAGNDPSKGSAYDPKADARSWTALQAALKAWFGE